MRECTLLNSRVFIKKEILSRMKILIKKRWTYSVLSQNNVNINFLLLEKHVAYQRNLPLHHLNY